LRGFAAVTVVIYHVMEMFHWYALPLPGFFTAWFRIGWAGVDLFFVISGFVITLSALKAREQDPDGFARAYLRRRLARIVPLHYLTCLAFVLFLAPALMINLSKFWVQALTHLTFSHTLFPRTRMTINAVNWSLGVEMQFYVLILVSTRFLARARVSIVVLSGVVISWIWRSFAFSLTYGQVERGLNMTWHATAQLPGVLDEFALGIGLAMLLHRDRSGCLRRGLCSVRWALPAFVALAAYATFSVYWKYPDYWHTPGMVVCWRTILGAFFLLVVVAACAIRDRWFIALTTPLRYLGTISYGIYLWHWLVIIAILPQLEAHPQQALAWVLGLTCLLATLSWHFFEKPFMERFGGDSRRTASTSCELVEPRGTHRDRVETAGRYHRAPHRLPSTNGSILGS
jgi:peptidoglycan/LPS O-acetylase OafA/YrhL